MAQDFWAGSGYTLLERDAAGGLVPTAAWIARLLHGDELLPPDDAGPHERQLHARLLAKPLLRVSEAEVAAVEDPDARENWIQFLHYRDRVFAHPTLEACYADLFQGPEVDIAPPFVDDLARAITRACLDGTDDPWTCRAGEMLFRRQRVSTEGGPVLAADATTVETYAETGGFGNMGRLLLSQNAAIPTPKMDVMSHENASLYFLRDELFSFLIDLTPGREGAAALAQVLERWVLRFTGVRVAIEPVARIDEKRWRWHVGLDVDATAVLNSLYRGEEVDAEDLARIAALFRLTFADPADADPSLGGRPVYLGLAFRPDRSLKMKPQNLLVNLPLRHDG